MLYIQAKAKQYFLCLSGIAYLLGCAFLFFPRFDSHALSIGSYHSSKYSPTSRGLESINIITYYNQQHCFSHFTWLSRQTWVSFAPSCTIKAWKSISSWISWRANWTYRKKIDFNGIKSFKLSWPEEFKEIWLVLKDGCA